MADISLIDVHTHTFATAERGTGWLRAVGNDEAAAARNGTTDELRGLMQQAGITHAVMLMYTPTRFMYEAALRKTELPDQPAKREAVERELKAKMVQRMVENNEWAVCESCKHPELITFAGLDPVYMDEQALLAEIDDKVAKGAKGVKIVPFALAVHGNDRRLWPVYDKISRMGIPMLSQSGRGGQGVAAEDPWARPKYFAEPLAEFPNLQLILAHLGRGFEEEARDLCKHFPNVHFDMSMRLHELGQPGQFTPESLADFIRTCGPEHILYGSNYPTCDPIQHAQVMRKLPLAETERELIGSGNAKRIIGID